jgi:transaldolase/glucose-6-phosphate isomerase
MASPRWARLSALGARPQRLLWASTSTKNPRYRDVMYVEQLIGPETVDTMPPATFQAFRDHGHVGPTLEADVEDARAVMTELAALGIWIDDVTDRLLVDGLRLFGEPFGKLLAAIESRRAAAAGASAPIP